jgi:hypothetical protein
MHRLVDGWLHGCAGGQSACCQANTLSASRPNTFGAITVSILAKTAGVVLAAATLCGLGVGTAAAATSDQVSSTTSVCTDLWNHWESKLNQEKAEIDALILKMNEEKESDPAQHEADMFTLQQLWAQYNRDTETASNQLAKCP